MGVTNGIDLDICGPQSSSVAAALITAAELAGNYSKAHTREFVAGTASSGVARDARPAYARRLIWTRIGEVRELRDQRTPRQAPGRAQPIATFDISLVDR